MKNGVLKIWISETVKNFIQDSYNFEMTLY